MHFDYERDTKKHYQSTEVAAAYQDFYSSGFSLYKLRHQLVARREIATVARMLSAVKHDVVLDIPCGTGKLADTFNRLGASVICADVSKQMLDRAARQYDHLKNVKTEFFQCDVEDVEQEIDRAVDVTVCLRLMHRLPPEVRDRALRSLGRMSSFVIASFGIETGYHKARRHVRHLLLGGGVDPLCFIRADHLNATLSKHFEIVDQAWVLPLLSQEKIYLLRPLGV